MTAETEPDQCEDFGAPPDETCLEPVPDDWDWDDVNGTDDWEYEP